MALTLISCNKSPAPFAKPHINSQSTSASSPAATRKKTKKIIHRAEECLHFSGEFGGDQSERDKEVSQEMDKLRCDTIAADLNKLNQQLPKDSPLAPKVKALLREYQN
ncbi:hypothetical protein EV682_102266 [Iodobacter fluviatilis]|uniref:Uncharacterized protein n=2 Tax=Iodobacter fluviatilis TaxID=537 RepID=A0A377Q626_9NEIS|nr:hypothetical protein EV682_102266 [Iodobacter fluviatilis]STQ90724.1 Uncharacterised protein [Iodobacter fluviatilis]